jgi:menaquinone-9 beta-reductase
MPDGLVALRDLGISPDRNRSFPFRGIRFCCGTASVEAEFPDSFGLGVRRTVLHELLSRHASDAGIELRWGTRVVGCTPGCVQTSGAAISCAWIIGADGQNSNVRRWSGLDRVLYERRRFGYRRHFEIAPWTDMVEVYWGDRCQIVITPVGPDRVCAALVSEDPRLRVSEAIRGIPELGCRLGDARPATVEKGSITAIRVLRRTTRAGICLVGDASGSVDAITGQGLCLSFKQALALSEAIANGNLRPYVSAQRRFALKPVLMSRVMQSVGRMPRFRNVAIRSLMSYPRLFQLLLEFHTGTRSGSITSNLRSAQVAEGGRTR